MNRISCHAYTVEEKGFYSSFFRYFSSLFSIFRERIRNIFKSLCNNIIKKWSKSIYIHFFREFNLHYTWGILGLERWCLLYLAYLSKVLEVSSFSSLELELWLEESLFAIWLANWRLRSSLYLAIRRSEAVEDGGSWLVFPDPVCAGTDPDDSLLILPAKLYRGSLLLPKLLRSGNKIK